MLGVGFRRFLVYFDVPHRRVEIPIAVAVLQVCHTKLEVLVGDVLRWRCLRVVGEDVVTLDAPVHSRKRNVVAVERRTPLVVDRAISRKVRLRRVLATFEAFDAAFDGFVRLHLTGCQASPDNFDRPANPFLDEVRGEVGFLAEAVVEGTLGFGFRGDVVSVVAVPAPLARSVGTVFELLDSLSKGCVGSFGNVEFDDGGTTVFHCAFTYTFGVRYMFGSWPVTVV
ncbi:IS1341-type transposase (plasmid) [Natrarchaeobaculum sulfurireducens]|uniref:IS1341-type transposase n=1 Tax=Natrarchaeobaculum sulfurireducens TaxID=2044521 RepID=A0A346PK79_9EURY|nr:IS1341-type transposase [Natrarchaeobaculum sulfurireducens]